MTPHTRQFWILQSAVWLGYGLENYVGGLGMGRSINYYQLSVVDALGGFLLTLVLRYGINRTWDWSLRGRLWTGASLLVATALAYAYLWMVAIDNMCATCRIPLNAFGYLSYFAGAMYLMIAWTGAYVGIKLARQLQQEKETALQATAIAHQAQLRMLRYQLNPHFLFNTLNAISTLILDGRREQANGMVGALSGFLRYSLESDPEQKVTLTTEILAAKRYLAIEQLRFGDRLKVGIAIGEDVADARVPSLILQPLIENAVKYAVSRNEEGGTIEISAAVDDGMLEIRVNDDGPGSADYRPNKGEGGGVGLANTRERLRVLYGANHVFSIVRLQPHGTAARLRFPFHSSSNEETPCASPR
ncbi:MAG: histidine kinase [Dokdonella sp.]